MEKNKGIHKKIEKNIKKFRNLNDKTSLIQVAMQDRIAKNIGTSEHGQKIDTYGEFFKKIKICASELKAASKRR
jgi:translation initiation factor 2 beta subunit (eIF-2beta)/eIF-5